MGTEALSRFGAGHGVRALVPVLGAGHGVRALVPI